MHLISPKGGFKFACHLDARHVRRALSHTNRKARGVCAKHCRGLKVYSVQQVNRSGSRDHIFVLALLEEVRLMFFRKCNYQKARKFERSLCVWGQSIHMTAQGFSQVCSGLQTFARRFKSYFQRLERLQH